MSETDRDLAALLSSARAGSLEALGEALEACRAYLLTVAGRPNTGDRQSGQDHQALGYLIAGSLSFVAMMMPPSKLCHHASLLIPRLVMEHLARRERCFSGSRWSP